MSTFRLVRSTTGDCWLTFLLSGCCCFHSPLVSVLVLLRADKLSTSLPSSGCRVVPVVVSCVDGVAACNGRRQTKKRIKNASRNTIYNLFSDACLLLSHLCRDSDAISAASSRRPAVDTRRRASSSCQILARRRHKLQLHHRDSLCRRSHQLLLACHWSQQQQQQQASLPGPRSVVRSL